MEQQIYQQIFDVENTHWWFAGRRKIIHSLLKKFIPKKVPKGLDIGSGTGLNARVMSEFCEAVAGIDPATEAVRLSKLRNPQLTVFNEQFPEITLPGTFDLICMFDVLEHIEDDKASVKRLESLLNSKGVAVITVPAFMFLWSDHDRLLHHFRRYTVNKLKNLVKQNTNLEIAYINYFNTLLFLPIVGFRILRKIFKFFPNRTDDFAISKGLNAFFYKIFLLDGWLMRHLRFPFGVSIVCVLKKS